MVMATVKVMVFVVKREVKYTTVMLEGDEQGFKFFVCKVFIHSS